MTQERPKRKATANKNYLDVIPDSLLEPFGLTYNSNLKNSTSATSSPSKQSYATGGSTRNRARTSNAKNSPSYGALLPASKNSQYGPKIPINWEPPVGADERFSHRLNLKDAFVDMDLQTLTCPNQPSIEVVASDPIEDRELQRLIWLQTGQKNASGSSAGRKSRGMFQILKGDYIYMVSEPPGEPYYIGRLMGFHLKGALDGNGPVDVNANYKFLIQWFYRPRDISKNTTDLRLLYASMHSDTCPISSFRGLLTVKHKLEVEKFYVPKLHGNAGESMSAVEYYSSLPNCFYFDKLFDRYMIKFYDIIKTSTLLEYLENETNNNKNYILALNKRYEYVFMEAARTKVFLNNFTSTMSTHCNICAEWCPSAESVTCSECGKHFHMLCLDPPLLKKPSRGFSWSCALCSKKHELEQLRKKILMLSHDNKTTNQDELSPEDSQHPLDGAEMNSLRNCDDILPKYELCAIEYLQNDADVSVAECRLREEWNIRYLGLHCKLEDAVDPDDRSPYPRASTSLGTKYQAINIPEYEDHPIVYYDVEKSLPDSGKSKKGPGGKKAAKRKVDTQLGRSLSVPPEFENVHPSQYPLWLQPRPKGYVERGEDDGNGETCTLLWKSSEEDNLDQFARHDAFVASCAPYAEKLDLHPNSPNFVDAVVKIYMDLNRNTERGMAAVKKLTRKSLKEPTLTRDEIKRFEAGVRKHGSEIFPISKEVKTQLCSALVRYYYIWKKTKNGQAIWGDFPGRKKKRKEPEMKVVKPGDTCADSDDDSSYENDKIIDQEKLFKCKHCHLFVSEEWFKITGFDGANKHDSSADMPPFADPNVVTALCFRCAKLWRRYAVYWEDPIEVERKSSRGVGGYKRKVEAELVADTERILKHADSIGAVFCPETPKSQIQCSVIRSSAFHKLQKPRKVQKPELQELLTADSMKEAKTTRLTSRQLSLSVKDAKEKTPETSKKIRKVEHKQKAELKVAEITVREPKVKAESKMKTDVKAKASEKTKGERKPELAMNGNQLANDGKKRLASVPKKEPPKKKKKSDTKTEPKVKREKSSRATTKATVKKTASSITPVFNPLYVKPSSFRSLLSLPLASTLLRRVLTAFRILQLATRETILENLTSQSSGEMHKVAAPAQVGTVQSVDASTLEASNALKMSKPKEVLVSLSNPTTLEKKGQELSAGAALSSNSVLSKLVDRMCSVCLEKDRPPSELMTCGTCGTMVHASCIGVSVPKHARPVKYWQCEMCMNDMNAKYGRKYDCCLCPNLNLQKSQISQTVNDHLIPIAETGQWCHVLCASFNFQRVTFKSAPSTSILVREGNRYSGVIVETVAPLLSTRRKTSCSICGQTGGLIECTKCLEIDLIEQADGGSEKRRAKTCTMAHITCAQRSSGYEVGFCFSKGGARVGAIAYLDSQLGRLVPSMTCDKHENNFTQPLRALGRRTPTAEKRSLLSLFLEDLQKTSLRGAHGPQLRSQNYLDMLQESLKEQPEKKVYRPLKTAIKKPRKCRNCRINCSPKWWTYHPSKTELVAEKNKPAELRNSDPNSEKAPSSVEEQTAINEILGTSREPFVVDTENHALSHHSMNGVSPHKSRRQSFFNFTDSSLLSASVSLESGKIDGNSQENSFENNSNTSQSEPLSHITSKQDSNAIPLNGTCALNSIQSQSSSPVHDTPKRPKPSPEMAAYYRRILVPRVDSPVREYLCQKCHFAPPIEVIEISDDEGDGDALLKELSQPLACPQLGLDSPSDNVQSVYKKITLA